MTDKLIRLDGQTLSLGAFTLTKTGLDIKGKPSFEEWERCGALLRRMEGAVNWWVGDWINFGETAYGEKYAQALEATGMEYGTLRNVAYVAANVSRRRDSLPWSHHAEVAALPPEEQETWLEKASTESLTRADLRHRIKVARRDNGHEIECWLLVRCDDAKDQEKLAETLRRQGRSVKLTTKGVS